MKVLDQITVVVVVMENFLSKDFVQSDKKIKTLTDTAELIEDAVHSATVE